MLADEGDSPGWTSDEIEDWSLDAVDVLEGAVRARISTRHVLYGPDNEDDGVRRTDFPAIVVLERDGDQWIVRSAELLSE
jgi:hypothetical protein